MVHGAQINQGKEEQNLEFSGDIKRYKEFACSYFSHLPMLFTIIS